MDTACAEKVGALRKPSLVEKPIYLPVFENKSCGIEVGGFANAIFVLISLRGLGA